MEGFFLLILALVFLPFLVLNLARVLDGIIQKPTWLTDLVTRFQRIKIWHVILAIAGCALVLAILNATDAMALILGGLTILVIFAREWLHEFSFLMSLRDKDFPGRFDKLIWAALLIGLAPVGIWTFRTYRLAHWTEPEPARTEAAPEVV